VNGVKILEELGEGVRERSGRESEVEVDIPRNIERMNKSRDKPQ